jgi:hypothetical protein
MAYISFSGMASQFLAAAEISDYVRRIAGLRAMGAAAAKVRSLILVMVSAFLFRLSGGRRHGGVIAVRGGRRWPPGAKPAWIGT